MYMIIFNICENIFYNIYILFSVCCISGELFLCKKNSPCCKIRIEKINSLVCILTSKQNVFYNEKSISKHFLMNLEHI